MSEITVTAEFIPATGLTQISTWRGGVMHAAKWVDVSRACNGTEFAVLAALRDAIGDVPNTITGSTITPGNYSMTVRLGR